MSFPFDDDAPVDVVDMFADQKREPPAKERECPYCGHIHDEVKRHGICLQCGRQIMQV